MFKRMFSRKKKEGDAAKEDDSESNHGFSFLKKSKCAVSLWLQDLRRDGCSLVPNAVLIIPALLLLWCIPCIKVRSRIERSCPRQHCMLNTAVHGWWAGARRRRRWRRWRRRRRRRQRRRTPSSWYSRLLLAQPARCTEYHPAMPSLKAGYESNCTLSRVRVRVRAKFKPQPSPYVCLPPLVRRPKQRRR